MAIKIYYCLLQNYKTPSRRKYVSRFFLKTIFFYEKISSIKMIIIIIIIIKTILKFH